MPPDTLACEVNGLAGPFATAGRSHGTRGLWMTDKEDPIGASDPTLELASEPTLELAREAAPVAGVAEVTPATLAAIQFKTDGVELPADSPAPAAGPALRRVGDLRPGVAVPAVGLTIGFGLVLLGSLLPMGQTDGRQPLLAIESVAAGAGSNAGYWFGLAAVVAAFAALVFPYAVFSRRGLRLGWVLLLVAIGAAETAGFALARHLGAATPDDQLLALPPILGIGGGMLTVLCGLALGLVGAAHDGLRCHECGSPLARDAGFCPDCGAWLHDAAPTRTRLAAGWNSGSVRGALGVVVAGAAVAAFVAIVIGTAPQS